MNAEEAHAVYGWEDVTKVLYLPIQLLSTMCLKLHLIRAIKTDLNTTTSI